MKWNNIAAIILGIAGILLAFYVILIPPAKSQENKQEPKPWFEKTHGVWIIEGQHTYCAIKNRWDKGFFVIAQDLVDEENELFIVYFNIDIVYPPVNEEIFPGMLAFESRTKPGITRGQVMFQLLDSKAAHFRYVVRDKFFELFTTSSKMFIGTLPQAPIKEFNLAGSKAATKAFEDCIKRGKELNKHKIGIDARWQHI